MNAADAMVMMLWRNALAAIPLALIVLAFCGCLRTRPSTRHALWLLVLLSLVMPPVIPGLADSQFMHETWARVSKSVQIGARSAWTSAALLATNARAEIKSYLDSRDSRKSDISENAQDCCQEPELAASAPAPQMRPNEAAHNASGSPEAHVPVETHIAQAAPKAVVAPTVAPVLSNLKLPRDETLAGREFSGSAVATHSDDSIERPSPLFARTPVTASMNSSATGRFFDQPRESNSDASFPHGNPRTHAPVLWPNSSMWSALDSSPLFALDREAHSLAKTSPNAKPQRRPAPADAKPRMAKLQTTPTTPANAHSNSIGTSAFSNAWTKIQASLQVWLNSLRAVRDALVRIPPVPLTIWLSGVLVILLVTLVRTWRFRRLLSRSHPAPDDVLAMVSRAARQIGLRHPPLTVMVDKSISPMIWCDRPMRLILPAPLWAELDDIGRRAVIVHELAHLKRRDHWVCWLTAAIGLIYWWHPLVWWCRRRLREEADFCCDTWVTTLLPRARRAYAQALLATRSFISETGCPVPVVGMGATSPRAKRFARRLTMVMTNTTAPSMSRRGLAGVAMMGLAAWLAAPLWACPPDSSSGDAATTKIKVKTPRATVMVPAAPRAPYTVVVPAPTTPPTPPAALEPDQSTYERYRTLAAQGSAPVIAPRALTVTGMALDDDVRQRLDQLETRLNRLGEQLEQLARSGALNAQPRQARPGQGAGASAGGMGGMLRRSGGAGGGEGMGIASANSSGGEGTIDRTYHLSGGKLEALTELMSRSDVPILITKQSDGIIVHATPRQQEVFAAFVRMIDPDNKEAQVAPPARARSMMDAQRAEERAQALAIGKVRRSELEAVQRARIAEGTARVQASRRQAEAMHREADRIRQKADQVRLKAEELRKRAEEIREKSSSAQNSDVQNQLTLQAQAVDQQAEQVDAQAEQIDAQAEQIDAQAEAADDQASAAEDQMEAMADELASQADEAAEVGATDVDEPGEATEAPESSEMTPPGDETTPLPPTPPAPPAPASGIAPASNSAPSTPPPASAPPTPGVPAMTVR